MLSQFYKSQPISCDDTKRRPLRVLETQQMIWCSEVQLSRRAIIRDCLVKVALARRSLTAKVVLALLAWAVLPGLVHAWDGPFPINSGGQVPQDQVHLSLDRPTCHALGTFLFKLKSSSKYKKVGQLSFRFLDADGQVVGSMKKKYRLPAHGTTLMRKYASCQKAYAFLVRHEPMNLGHSGSGSLLN